MSNEPRYLLKARTVSCAEQTAAEARAAFDARADLVNEARDFLIDCGADRDLAEVATDQEVLAEIDRHYVGGVSQFEADAK